MNLAPDLAAYLERIHYRQTPGVDLETLQGLHIGHCLHIPFENLDLHLGRPIRLDPPGLFAKMVHRPRGGYCFEMNGLFACVLEQLGFGVRRLLARVLHHHKLEPRNHQLMLVHLEGRDWVVDVGFGGRGLTAPIPLENRMVEKQFAETLRLLQHPDHGWVLQTWIETGWEDQYGFTLEPYLPVDYETLNYYYSVSPDSYFTQRRLCTLPTTEGFLRLHNRELTITANGKTVQESADSEDEYRELLKRHFAIELDGDFVTPCD